MAPDTLDSGSTAIATKAHVVERVHRAHHVASIARRGGGVLQASRGCVAEQYQATHPAVAERTLLPRLARARLARARLART